MTAVHEFLADDHRTGLVAFRTGLDGRTANDHHLGWEDEGWVAELGIQPGLPANGVSRLLSLCLCSVGFAAAAPASFHDAVGSLSRMLMIGATGPDSYLVEPNVLIRYDRATGGIFVRKILAPLKDQGAYIASQFSPVWCDIQGNSSALAARLNVFYTALFAKSDVARRQAKAGATVRITLSARVGQCDLRVRSQGLDSFLFLKPTGGPFVWPPRETR